MALITVNEFSTLKHISKKVDTDRINQSIDAAQSVDLYDYVGNFLFDIVANKDAVPYADLMDGSSFTIDGKGFTHEGIKSLLADLTFSRYLASSNVQDTAFGLVTKLSNDSQPIDRNTIKDLVKQAQIDADKKFQLIHLYLNENLTTFSRYCKADNPNINTFSQRFDII